MRPGLSAVFWLLAAGLTTGCGASAADKGGPFFEVEWSGSDSGKLGASATAEWCDSLRLVEIRAVRGDTGLGLALYPRERFVAGRYPVKAPASADSFPPAGAVGLRLFGETALKGYQGDSGSVEVRESPPGVYAGTLEARAHSVTEGSRVTIRGSFRDLTLRPATRGCVARKATGDSGAGVH